MSADRNFDSDADVIEKSGDVLPQKDVSESNEAAPKSFFKDILGNVKKMVARFMSKENFDRLKTQTEKIVSDDNVMKGKKMIASLKSAEGRRNALAKYLALPMVLKVVLGGTALLMFFFLLKGVGCVVGVCDSSQILARLAEEDLFQMSYVNIKPKKGWLYINKESTGSLQVFNSDDSKVIVVPKGDAPEAMFTKWLFDDAPLSKYATEEAFRKAPIVIECDSEYSDGEALPHLVYEYIGLQNVSLKKGKTKLRAFRECSKEFSQEVFKVKFESDKVKTEKYLRGILFKYDCDIDAHLFAAKSMKAGFEYSKEGSDGIDLNKARAFVAAAKKKDYDAARDLLGIEIAAESSTCRFNYEKFANETGLNVHVKYENEDAVKKNGGSRLVELDHDGILVRNYNEDAYFLRSPNGDKVVDCLSQKPSHYYYLVYSRDYKNLIAAMGNPLEENKDFQKKNASKVRKVLDDYVRNH